MNTFPGTVWGVGVVAASFSGVSSMEGGSTEDEGEGAEALVSLVAAFFFGVSSMKRGSTEDE